jgi:hypothetical protein
MIDNSKEYVICAAIWYKDSTEAPRGMIAQNIDSGVVIGQWRHGNCINVRATNPIWNKKTLKERVDRESQDIPMMVSNEKPDIEYDYVDGFLTSKGRFVDRWQAAKIAMDCGQLSESMAVRGYDRSEEDISDDEVMNSEPKHRSGHDRGRFKMIYSEDLY